MNRRLRKEREGKVEEVFYLSNKTYNSWRPNLSENQDVFIP